MSVGLDIGSKTIKMVELAKDSHGYRLNASGVIAHKFVTPDLVENDKQLVPLADSIRNLRKEAKISSRDVAISLPESQVFTRTIRFPLLNDAEVASAVKWEAEQYIPIPIEEALVQHQIIERRENSSPPQVVVLLVAVARKLVEKYARLVELSGMNLVVVETELMAMSRSLAPEGKTVLIVDLGAKSTDIAVVKNKSLVFSRSIPTAGDAFSRAVSQALGVDEVQAEEYKRTYGMSTKQLEGKIKAALDPILMLVSNEIKKAIQYYQSEENGESPASVILSGGGAGMPEIASGLAKMVGMEVSVGNPFANCTVDPQAMKELIGYAPFYSVAVGLAMRT